MKKFITIATALAISLVAVGSANAQTVEELQAQIAQLQAMIAQLTSQLGTTTTTTTTGTTSIPAVCSGITFTRNLTIGSRGADVKCLQALLNQDPATQLAATGAGSPGQETDYFGPITKAAVIKFQEKYASEVLTPLGLTKGTGYVGNATIAKLNSILSSASVVPTTPTYTPTPTPEPYTPPVTGEEEEEEEEEEELSGGEGEVRNFEVLGDPSDEELEEGDSNHKVLGVSFKANGSDLKLNRVKVYFSKTSATGSYRPWRYFDKVSLYLGDEKIAEKDADQDNWSEDDDSGIDGDSTYKDYAMTFTGLNEVIKEGDEAELYVAVTMVDNLDSSDESTTFSIWIPKDGIRFTDATGLNVYADDDPALGTFSTTSLSDADVKLSYDSDENGNRMIDVDDENNTNNVEVLRFSLQSKNDESLLTDLGVDIASTGTNINSAISRIKLYKGNTIVKTKSVSATGTTTTITFDDIDLNLPEDEKIEFIVKADFRALGTDFSEGDSVAFDIDSSDVIVENNQGDILIVTGSAIGGTIYAYDAGIEVKLDSTEAKRTLIADSTGEKDQADFTIKFAVTAFDSDIYILNSAKEVDSNSGEGVLYDLVATSDENNIESTLTETLSSTATLESSGFRKVPEGQTKTFTLKVTASAHTNDAYAKVVLDTIRWNTTATTTNMKTYDYFNPNDWQTEEVFLNVF